MNILCRKKMIEQNFFLPFFLHSFSVHEKKLFTSCVELISLSSNRVKKGRIKIIFIFALFPLSEENFRVEKFILKNFCVKRRFPDKKEQISFGTKICV